MKTRGQQIADAVRDYLFTNGLKQSQLTGTVLAEIADRVLVHIEKTSAVKKRLATEEDWIVELEREPHLEGVNVRKELAGCQFWCKNQTPPVSCTRRRFTNWLNRSERVVSPGGAQTKANGKTSLQGPKGWLTALNERYPDSTLARGGSFEILNETDYQWARLTADVREAIIETLRANTFIASS